MEIIKIKEECKIKNKDLIISNLNEARGELNRMFSLLADDNYEFTEGRFRVSLTHAYHHLNFDWNI